MDRSIKVECILTGDDNNLKELSVKAEKKDIKSELKKFLTANAPSILQRLLNCRTVESQITIIGILMKALSKDEIISQNILGIHSRSLAKVQKNNKSSIMHFLKEFSIIEKDCKILGAEIEDAILMKDDSAEKEGAECTNPGAEVAERTSNTGTKSKVLSGGYLFMGEETMRIQKDKDVVIILFKSVQYVEFEDVELKIYATEGRRVFTRFKYKDDIVKLKQRILERFPYKKGEADQRKSIDDKEREVDQRTIIEDKKGENRQRKGIEEKEREGHQRTIIEDKKDKSHQRKSIDDKEREGHQRKGIDDKKGESHQRKGIEEKERDFMEISKQYAQEYEENRQFVNLDDNKEDYYSGIDGIKKTSRLLQVETEEPIIVEIGKKVSFCDSKLQVNRKSEPKFAKKDLRKRDKKKSSRLYSFKSKKCKDLEFYKKDNCFNGLTKQINEIFKYKMKLANLIYKRMKKEAIKFKKNAISIEKERIYKMKKLKRIY